MKADFSVDKFQKEFELRTPRACKFIYQVLASLPAAQLHKREIYINRTVGYDDKGRYSGLLVKVDTNNLFKDIRKKMLMVGMKEIE
jgi:hypothetical protein